MRGKSLQSMYTTWANMIQRCTNPERPDYKNWGGRGITVCERWRCITPRGTGFKNFVSDMGMRPEGLTLDRINNDGNYEPNNCRWATRREQRLNSRSTTEAAVAAHAANQKAITHCPLGHEYTPENTYTHNGCRQCRWCRVIKDRFKYWEGKKTIEELSYPIGKPGKPKVLK